MPSWNGAPGIVHDPDGFVSARHPRARTRRLHSAVGAGLAAVALLLPAPPAAAQVAEVTREENFRNEPNGGLIGVLAPGTELVFHGRRENWIEATMEGWVWSRSLLTTERANYDLVVSTGEGENLRDRPSGEILGRLEDGTFLLELERIPGWIRVRRRGWIWAASVSVDESASAPDAAVTSVPVTPPPSSSASAGASPPPRTTGSAPPGVLRSTRGLAILSAPNGDTLSVLDPDAEVSVLAREGNWARVRIEGWVWQPTGGDTDATSAPVTSSGAGPTLDEVRRDPAANRGRIVTWSLQYVSLERAEAIRTDFFEGEPFLLMRPAGGDSSRFVYVAVPPELLSSVGALVELETLTVVGRIRTGASRLTGSPILDLIEIR